MTLTAEQAEAAEYSSRRGDVLERVWTRTDGASALDADSEVIELRTGPHEGSRLVASSVVARQGATVAAIDTTGTDLEGDPAVIAFAWDADESLKIPASARLWLEIEVTRDGKATTIQRHQWFHEPQVAVRP